MEMKSLQAVLEHGFNKEIPVMQMTEQEYEQRKCDRYNAEEGDLHIADGYECALCKNKGFTAEVREVYNHWSETLIPCKCQRARKAIHRLNRSGLQNVVKKYTFDKYEAVEPWQQSCKAAAMRFCKDAEHNWLFIAGQSGSGKTHLCTAATVHFIRKGNDAQYMLWRDDIAKIKAVGTDAVEREALVKPLKETPVLYIDDLFKMGKDRNGNVEPPTPTDVNIAFEIINHRYNNPQLITIISSERTLTELCQIDEAVAGRIAERTKEAGYCLNIKRDPARNWRMRGLEEI